MTENMTIREALISMGYREEAPGKWLKPIGYQLFSFNEATNQWCNYFTDIKGEICLWEKHTLNDALNKKYDPLFLLKDWETWTKHDLYVNGKSQFHLSAIDI